MKKLEKGFIDAKLIALYFLSKESMTNKKLQKLCYYAQAWHYAFYDKGLFYQDIQAWVHGPVVKEVYDEYKNYKWNHIPKIADELVPKLSEDIIELLDDVYDKYGQFSGDQLELLTHSELPWLEARKGLEEWQPSDKVINPNTMSNYYWEKYEQFN